MKTDTEIEKLLASAKSPQERQAAEAAIALSKKMLIMRGEEKGFCVVGYLDQWESLVDAAKKAGWMPIAPETSLDETPCFIGAGDAGNLSKVLKRLVVSTGEGARATKCFLNNIRKTLKSAPVRVDYCKPSDLQDLVKATIGPLERLKLRFTSLPPVR